MLSFTSVEENQVHLCTQVHNIKFTYRLFDLSMLINGIGITVVTNFRYIHSNLHKRSQQYS